MSGHPLMKIYKNLNIKEEELKLIINAHERVEFEKGQLFLERGQMANAYYFIEVGLARAFTYDFKGDEITTDFIGENEILIEVSSLFRRIPAQENLQALSDGVAWRIVFNTFQDIYHKSSGFNEWGRAWMSEQLFSLKQRHIDSVSLSASDRYLKLLTHKTQVIQQASLKYIASYLGITDTSLSRIRKEILSK